MAMERHALWFVKRPLDMAMSNQRHPLRRTGFLLLCICGRYHYFVPLSGAAPPGCADRSPTPARLRTVNQRRDMRIQR